MEPHLLGMGCLGCPTNLIDLRLVMSSVSTAKHKSSDESLGRSTEHIRPEQFAIASLGLYLEREQRGSMKASIIEGDSHRNDFRLAAGPTGPHEGAQGSG